MSRFLPLILVLGPLAAAAQTFSGIASSITGVLQVFIPVLFLLATVVFIWGVIMYITAAGDEEKIREGKKYIIWGLIGLFVMLSVWGLVRIIANTFFPGGAPQAPGLPDIPGSGG